ncbi:E1.11.1.7 [Lepeophtheirus salmonis]|uniref:Ascorbate peroxidase n=1 Tax=Lepeophtheirus salmonis TaxID=72036 RepID=D3PI01_LEPSM|nr:ascorbate peroxidase [Lepeophtheirus salmonis]CAB4062798.1 E1.11.1.7 [Lepeophtheirus salmonis]CAF2911455.1 E1.11.1.7 [Lepeophtheirus salmonis]
MKLVITSLLITLCFIPKFIHALDKSTVDKILEDLKSTIGSAEEDGVKFLIPGIVRMVFHDCADGCDACLNLDHPANVGIERTLNSLEPVYESYRDSISRADLWALASKAAFEMSVDINNERCQEESCKTPKVNIRFKFGRTDCSTSPRHSQNMVIPSPFDTSDTLMPWFKETFGFKPNEVVAIMGLHTLGKAGSPFNRAWENDNKDGLSNFYYKKISDPNHCWVQEYIDPELSGAPNKLFFWRTGEFKGFALPIDMTLFKDIQVESTKTGESSCTYYDCNKASTAGMFKRYANDIKNWTKHIERLYSRIIEKTSDNLKNVRKNK